QAFKPEISEKSGYQHDVRSLNSKGASYRRVAIPRAMHDQFIYYRTKLGVPDRNYKLDGQLEFEGYFGSPHGSYKTILTYPTQHATVSFTIGRPSGIWLITDFGVTYERPPE